VMLEMLSSLADPSFRPAEDADFHYRRTITRRELARAALSACESLSHGQAAAFVDEMLQEITDALAQGEEVTLCNFGKFAIVEKKERTGRNPRTGEAAVVSRRRVVSFRASRYLKSIVRNEGVSPGHIERQ
jgi:integration host factor subunit alpha